jgi:hypothetical protein
MNINREEFLFQLALTKTAEERGAPSQTFLLAAQRTFDG